MALPLFPNNLLGLSFGTKKTPIWQTQVRQAANGKEVRKTNWTYPRYKFQLSYEFLRDNVNAEYQTLVGFCNSMQGQFGAFVFNDIDDYTVTDQAIGVGDGSTLEFPLVRAYGGYIEPVQYAAAITNVKKNGVTLTHVTDWEEVTIGTGWGGGVNAIGLTVAPAIGDIITASFSYYYVCRFTQDEFEFSKMMQNFFELPQIEFESVK